MLNNLLRTARAAQIKSSDDFAAHMTEYAEWIAQLPRGFGMSSSSVGSHVMHKHALAFEAQLSRQGQALDWSSIANTMVEFKKLLPGQSECLDSVPSWLKPNALATQLGCGPLWWSTWPSLMREALQAWPGCLELAEARQPHLEASLHMYLAKFAVAPSPFNLIKEFLQSLPANEQPAILDNNGCFEEAGSLAEEEEEEEALPPEAGNAGGESNMSIGGGAPAGKVGGESVDSVGGVSSESDRRRSRRLLQTDAPQQSNKRRGADWLAGDLAR